MANFFEQQAQARSATTRLVILYAIAVLVICAAVTILTSFVIGGVSPVSDSSAEFGSSVNFRVELFAATITLAIIGFGTLLRMHQLGGNGVGVAVMLGGIPIDPATKDPLQRRLLNVVEEMALASGIPVPRVFLLKNESGINAFAAGMKPGEAVIGVTQGTLEKLSRDELQGVVAHEFSHIFNGDMRLNLRLMGVLGGILAITSIGRLLTRSRSSSSSGKRKGNSIALFGVGLLVIGYIGVFFARLIKAAVSRQREYLADASAVQYTRNPDGIGGALMKIRGLPENSKVGNAYAEEASHLFFGSVSRFSFLFATHPPLEKRISRISPLILEAGWQKRPSLEETAFEHSSLASGFSGSLEAPQSMPARRAPRSQTEAAAARAIAIVDTVGTPELDDLMAVQEKLRLIPDEVRTLLNTSDGAMSGIIALLLNSESGSVAQIALIKEELGFESLLLAQEMHRALDALVHDERLTILELAIPALRILDTEKKRSFLILCRNLVHADGRYDLFEYVALTLLDHQFFGAQRKNRPRPRLNAAKTTNDLSMVISAIAYAGTDDVTKAKAAFDAGVNAIRETNAYPLTFRSADECRLQAIADSIDRLSFLEPRSQKIAVDACVRAIIHDKVVNQDEAELLKAICTVLEAPLPATAV